MGQPKKILVPLDGSSNAQRALDKAITFAKPFGAKIAGISVIYHVPVTGIHNVKAMRATWVKQARKILATAKKHCAQRGVDFSEKIATGYAGDEIVNYARKSNCGLIVMGSRGLSGPKAAILGSVSSHVLHKARMPVVIVK